MKLLEVTVATEKVKEALKQLEVDYQAQKKELTKELKDLKRQKDICMTNADTEKVKRAEQIVQVRGRVDRFNSALIQEAISDIIAGAPKLSETYFGLKDYAHWTNQRSDHSYYMGPMHGDIIFRVELTQYGRLGNLLDEEVEAVLYYLNKLIMDKDFRKAVINR